MIMSDWVMIDKRGGLKMETWNFPVVKSQEEEEDIATETEKEHSCDQRKTKKKCYTGSQVKKMFERRVKNCVKC